MPLIDSAVEHRGYGIVYAVLDALSQCHAAHVESAAHAVFVKMHFKKATCVETPPCWSRSQILMQRAAEEDGASKLTVKRDRMQDVGCESDGATHVGRGDLE